jgi:4-hydroxy-4-methyl-2-oxoglutarate aldolase
LHKIVVDIERPDPALVERFHHVWSECVVQALNDVGQLMDPAIKPLCNNDWLLIGPAVTVAANGTDTLAPIVGVGVAQPGDVVVVAAHGDCTGGIWGAGLTLSAKNLGCAGAVVDGAAMDATMILKTGIPVFCRTTVMNHAVGSKPGSINVPVRCGGVQVEPGDLIMGNLDGVLVVPKARLEDVLRIAEEKTATLIAAKAKLVPGVTLFHLRGGREMAEAKGMTWVR